ncbi:MAG: DUF4062 domain-containing protein [Acidobacteria bacterium]|nr:DUF4062 domain-containing protein [Acidobacteriota bacterium]
MTSRRRTFRVFISSTFEDLKEEREALQRKVFRNLAKLCEQYQAGFQAIDLRWGVRDEAALDQKTMDICLREIERCQRTGIKPNFIMLLGQRYGWRPLPSRIEAVEFEHVLEAIGSSEEKAMLSRWYRLDENADPPEYALQPRTEQWTDSELWSSLEARLHGILCNGARAAGIAAGQMVKYEASATHQEILKGLGSTPEDRRHVFAFCRDVPDEGRDPELVNLKKFLAERLPSANILSYAPGDFARLCQDVERVLAPIIESEAAKFRSGPSQELAMEIETHDVFSRERSQVFGRNDVLDKIADYVGAGDSRVLILLGASGSGKSAVMAQASERVRLSQSNAVVIRRFVGISPESSNGLALLRSLCLQIGEAYGARGEMPVEFKEVERIFHERLGLASPGAPLVIFVDGLNQLGKDDPASSLNWLSGPRPPHCRIIVSTTEPAPVLRESRVLTLSALSRADAEAALDYWLEAAHRKLRPDQREILLSAFDRCSLPLYLRLAFEEARGWASYFPLKKCLLGDGVDGIIQTFFDRLSLESNHGSPLVSRSLGYLAASRYGLSEDEMIKLLSADRIVWKDFRNRAHHEPPEHSLPVIVWSRLHFDLEPYLSERIAGEAQVIAFYHSQVREAATRHYLDSRIAWHRHLHMARLFERACTDRNRYLPRKRAIGEMAYHYRICNNRRKLKSLYADMSFICSYVKCHNAFDLKDEIQMAPDPCVDGEMRSFIADTALLLAKYPEQAPQLLYKELSAESCRRQAELLAVRPWIRADRIRLEETAGDFSIGVSPAVSTEMRVEASCVAVKANLAFIHNASNKIELIRTGDLRPRGEILLPHPSRAIGMMLCDPWGRLLALVYDDGEIEFLKTVFDTAGNILSTSRVHRGTCNTGRFGLLSACALPDEIIYQAPDRRVISLQMDAGGKVSQSEIKCNRGILQNYFCSNTRCFAWKDGKDNLLAFPELDQTIALDYRATAVCRSGTRLVVSSEDGRLLIYKWPDLEKEKAIACRLPVMSISPSDHGFLLMTDRHGNILSLDDRLEMTDYGRCSYDLYDDYPSAIYPAPGGAFYISNHRCVTLSIGGKSRRDILQIDGDGDKVDLLTYSRDRGYELSVASGPRRLLAQEIVGRQHEFEYNNFKSAWSRSGSVAYSRTARSVAFEGDNWSVCHPTESEIVKIMYVEMKDCFLVLCSSGMLYIMPAKSAALSTAQLARSDTGNYLMEVCGANVCVVAQNVLCKTGPANIYAETVVSLHRISDSGTSLKAELIDVQHLANNQSRIIGLSFHRGSNNLYMFREGSLERWQLDQPKRHNVTRLDLQGGQRDALSFCAARDGVFYVDADNHLKFQPMTAAKGATDLASSRTITFLSPKMGTWGYMVEDNHGLYRFLIDE